LVLIDLGSAPASLTAISTNCFLLLDIGHLEVQIPGDDNPPLTGRNLKWWLIISLSHSHFLGIEDFFSSYSVFTLRFLKQHCLYFKPLLHGQGSLRPTFVWTVIGAWGFRSRSTSEISSGLSGSTPTTTFQSWLSQSAIISPALSMV
jgi:hypothetical protein